MMVHQSCYGREGMDDSRLISAETGRNVRFVQK
jgi:hypothetical protein